MEPVLMANGSEYQMEIVLTVLVSRVSLLNMAQL